MSRGFTTRVIALLAAFGAFATTSWAADVEGKIAASGSAYEIAVTIQGVDGVPVAVCVDAMAKRLRRIAGYSARVTGEWLTRDDGSRCLVAAGFRVTRGFDGRDALVGILSRQGGTLALTLDDGRTVVIDTPTVGLRYRAGQRVIVTAREAQDPRRGTSVTQVISYMPYP